MAEAVKNNSRKRRPPSHLYEGYNEDNFEPGNNQFFPNRDPNRQPPDPFTIPVMARLFAKFVNSTNKKCSQGRIKKQEQQNASSLKRQTLPEPKPTAKTDKPSKQDRQTGLSRVRETEEGRQNANRQELLKERYQQKNFKKVPNPANSSSLSQPKKVKAPSQLPQSLIKNTLPSHDLFNIESMAKISREQLFKMLPKGTDPNLFKQQLMQSASVDRNLTRLPNFDRLSGIRPNQFRQDTKLFKRASFHIGIAYNIHIETVKQKNPHFSQEELDPTYVSRKLKQESTELLRKQNEEKLRQEAIIKQRQQALLANKPKQKQMRIEQQQAQNKQIMKSGQKKQPICIDIEDESQEKLEVPGDPSAQDQMGKQKEPQAQISQGDQSNKMEQPEAKEIKVQPALKQEEELVGARQKKQQIGKQEMGVIEQKQMQGE